jgi:hypothetical protein
VEVGTEEVAEELRDSVMLGHGSSWPGNDRNGPMSGGTLRRV